RGSQNGRDERNECSMTRTFLSEAVRNPFNQGQETFPRWCAGRVRDHLWTPRTGIALFLVPMGRDHTRRAGAKQGDNRKSPAAGARLLVGRGRGTLRCTIPAKTSATTILSSERGAFP